MKRPCLRFCLIFAALATLRLDLPATASEQVPFRARFAGVATAISFNPPIACGITNGTGNATHLGRFAFQHPHCANLVTFSLEGTFRIVAANGDEIHATYTGQSSATSTPGVRRVLGTATITSGTGRFAGASGSFTVDRLFNMAMNTTVGTFDGFISSPGANH